MMKMIREVYGQHGNVDAPGSSASNQMANLVMEQMGGGRLSIEQIEKLKDIYDSNMGVAKKNEEINKILEETKPIDEQALKVSKEGFAGIKKHMAGVEAMQIHIGSKVAPMMMKLQMAQLEMVKTAADYLPKIFKVLEDIWKTIVTWWSKTMKMPDPAKAWQEISGDFNKMSNAIEKSSWKGVKGLRDKGQADLAAAQTMQIRKAYSHLTSGPMGMVGMIASPAYRKSVMESMAGADTSEKQMARRQIDYANTVETYFKNKGGDKSSQYLEAMTAGQTKRLAHAAQSGDRATMERAVKEVYAQTRASVEGKAAEAGKSMADLRKGIEDTEQEGFLRPGRQRVRSAPGAQPVGEARIVGSRANVRTGMKGGPVTDANTP